MRLVLHLLTLLHALASDRSRLALENLVLRQQLNVLRRGAKWARLDDSDRVFWVLVHRLFKDWKDHLVIVKPETVIRWHRQGFCDRETCASRCAAAAQRPLQRKPCVTRAGCSDLRPRKRCVSRVGRLSAAPGAMQENPGTNRVSGLRSVSCPCGVGNKRGRAPSVSIQYVSQFATRGREEAWQCVARAQSASCWHIS